MAKGNSLHFSEKQEDRCDWSKTCVSISMDSDGDNGDIGSGE